MFINTDSIIDKNNARDRIEGSSRGTSETGQIGASSQIDKVNFKRFVPSSENWHLQQRMPWPIKRGRVDGLAIDIRSSVGVLNQKFNPGPQQNMIRHELMMPPVDTITREWDVTGFRPPFDPSNLPPHMSIINREQSPLLPPQIAHHMRPTWGTNSGSIDHNTISNSMPQIFSVPSNLSQPNTNQIPIQLPPTNIPPPNIQAVIATIPRNDNSGNNIYANEMDARKVTGAFVNNDDEEDDEGDEELTQADLLTQPIILTFKQFVASKRHLDTKSKDEQKKQYENYKMDFKRQQINEYFINHKDEEWFKFKYYPDENINRKMEIKKGVKARLSVFLKLMNLKRLDKLSLDLKHTKEIIKLLDAAVILLEGGEEFDLTVLDTDDSNKHDILRSTRKSPFTSKKDRNYHKKRSTELSSIKYMDSMKYENSKSRNSKDNKKVNNSSALSDTGSISDSDNESNSIANQTPIEAKLDNSIAKDGATDNTESKGPVELEEGEHEEERKAKPLHKTVSLFLKNILPKITSKELEELCQKYPGFLRLALQDPLPEKNFPRRGWVTFDPTVNIREICWAFNNIKLKDCEMGAIVNSELKQRVRNVNGLTGFKTVAKQDIKRVVKIIQHLDNIHGVWEEDEASVNTNSDADKLNNQSFGFISKNPLLKNITDYLVDEGNYEEEALLDKNRSTWDELDDKFKPSHAEVFIDSDHQLLRVLDKMIIYLRIVHSIDYYGTTDYKNEDNMPHRCGIIHVRSSLPTNRITHNDVNEWTYGFDKRITAFMQDKLIIDTGEIAKLGLRDINEEVEKFIKSNTQELSKNKWFCPLSGKKFKGADYVRKHLLTKHQEKVKEVKEEALYYNNYLSDPKRPRLPDHPSTLSTAKSKSHANIQNNASNAFSSNHKNNEDDNENLKGETNSSFRKKRRNSGSSSHASSSKNEQSYCKKSEASYTIKNENNYISKNNSFYEINSSLSLNSNYNLPPPGHILSNTVDYLSSRNPDPKSLGYKREHNQGLVDSSPYDSYKKNQTLSGSILDVPGGGSLSYKRESHHFDQKGSNDFSSSYKKDSRQTPSYDNHSQMTNYKREGSIHRQNSSLYRKDLNELSFEQQLASYKQDILGRSSKSPTNKFKRELKKEQGGSSIKMSEEITSDRGQEGNMLEERKKGFEGIPSDFSYRGPLLHGNFVSINNELLAGGNPLVRMPFRPHNLIYAPPPHGLNGPISIPIGLQPPNFADMNRGIEMYRPRGAERFLMRNPEMDIFRPRQEFRSGMIRYRPQYIDPSILLRQPHS